MATTHEDVVADPSTEATTATDTNRTPIQLTSPEMLDTAAQRTVDWLLAQQRGDGHWVGELEGDTILETEYILLKIFLGEDDDPKIAEAARYIYRQERPEGGWAIYPDGPFEISATVKAYFALKLAGYDFHDPVLTRARDLILEAGGASQCNSFTRFYLALLGQVDYHDCPSVPPELAMLPRWFPIHLHAMSAWTRPIVIPLAILSVLKPVRRLEPGLGIAELFLPDQPRHPIRRSTNPICWANAFLLIDAILKRIDRTVPRRWRQAGLDAALRWMRRRFEDSDGLGAIFPPMVYTLVALRALGFEDDHPDVAWARERLDNLILRDEDGDDLRIQPCLSPVWDTAISTIALTDAEVEQTDQGQQALGEAIDWLCIKEVRRVGDWAVKRPQVEPSGWHFQYDNAFYPDIDDTAMVLMGLHRNREWFGRDRLDPILKRGRDWVLALQGRDGGWAAFDADIDNEVLTQIPFADHNAMLDPSCPDITARILEMLGTLDLPADHPSIQRGLDYLWRTQEADGCWYGRWGVNYIYGTWQVLQGLAAIDHPMSDPRLVHAADWLESVQQTSGAWGETCATYEDPSLRGIGESTASQTAWAVLGLIAAGRGHGMAVARGVDWLVANQRPDGNWDEAPYTGTGFPKVFYLRYHYYRTYFPLMALARARRVLEGRHPWRNDSLAEMQPGRTRIDAAHS